METLRLVLITVLSAVVLACVLGVIIGKHQVKKAKGLARSLLSAPERIVYTTCVILGICCLLVGIFYSPKPVSEDGMAGMDPGMAVEEFPGGDPAGPAPGVDGAQERQPEGDVQEDTQDTEVQQPQDNVETDTNEAAASTVPPIASESDEPVVVKPIPAASASARAVG